MIKQLEGYVYESPDGGNTVYARPIGSDERTLVYQSPAAHLNNRYHKWRDVLALAAECPALEKAIADAELIYELVKEKD